MSYTGTEFIRQREMSLTNPKFYDRVSFVDARLKARTSDCESEDWVRFPTSTHHMKKQVYVFKAAWQSTAKLVQIKACDEDEAWEKAHKSKECKNCCKLQLVKVDR